MKNNFVVTIDKVKKTIAQEESHLPIEQQVSCLMAVLYDILRPANDKGERSESKAQFLKSLGKSLIGTASEPLEEPKTQPTTPAAPRAEEKPPTPEKPN